MDSFFIAIIEATQVMMFIWIGVSYERGEVMRERFVP